MIELLDGEELELAAGAGELPDDLLGKRVSRWRTPSPALRCAPGRSQRLTDRLNRARFEQHGLGHLGLTAEDGLVVPLMFRDRGYGVLVADRPSRLWRFHRGASTTARGVCGQRCHGRRDGQVGRRRSPAPAPSRRRSRAREMGARAPRRDAASARKPEAGAVRGRVGPAPEKRCPTRSLRRSSSSSSTWPRSGV